MAIKFNDQESSLAICFNWGPTVPLDQPRSFSWSWSGVMPVTLIGQSSRFMQGTTAADFGRNITVASLAVASPTSVTAAVNIDPGAAVMHGVFRAKG